MSREEDELRAAFAAIADAADEPGRLDDAARRRVLNRVETIGPSLVGEGIDPDVIRRDLADLADEGSPSLGRAARTRILAHIERVGPSIVARSRADETDELDSVDLELDAAEFDAGEFDAGEFDAGEFDAGDFDAGDSEAADLEAADLDAADFRVRGFDFESSDPRVGRELDLAELDATAVEAMARDATAVEAPARAATARDATARDAAARDATAVEEVALDPRAPRALRVTMGRRVAWGVFAVSAAAAALLAVVQWLGVSGSAARLASGGAPTPDRACTSLPPASGVVRDGRLDLGVRGRAEVEGNLFVRADTGCLTELVLGEGRVRVEADDLGGGSLIVWAGETSVEVWGTRFTVLRDGAHQEVSVEEGHVVVRAPEARELHLRAGERWQRGQVVASAVEASAVEASAVEASAVEAPGGSGAMGENEAGELASPRLAGSDRPRSRHREPRDVSSEQLAEAEQLWRDGDRDRARGLFARVGRGHGPRAAAAWVRLARLELRGGAPERALAATREQGRRFASSPLSAEALWIEAEALERLGRSTQRRAALTRLRTAFPSSPQGLAAARALGDVP
ncbi:MAG: hypothetical protein AB7S26_02290 [Sandaracinaceae bacterium]